MLGLKEGSPVDMLRQFAVHLGADMEEEFQAAKLILDNDRGRGTITVYEPFPGLTAWVYHINFKTDFVIDLEFSDNGPFYFGYPMNGHQLQKFPNDKEYRKIEQKRNFIILGKLGDRSEFVIPANEDFSCCYLILDPWALDNSGVPIRKQLAKSLLNILHDIGKERPYRYFGDIDLNTGKFASIIVNNKRTDVVGRLLTEGAILNLLAGQIEAYNLSKSHTTAMPDIGSAELIRITKIGDYVTANIGMKVNIPDICDALGINAKKLQAGVRLLYGHSVARYVQNLKLEASKELIHNTDLKIYEISNEVGFTSKSYFSRLFEQRFGIFPGKYRTSLSNSDLFFEISYRSMAQREIKEADIADLIGMARESNIKYGVTGCLIFYGNVFFQLMEGPKGSVIQLYENIKKDIRHFDIITLHRGTKVYRDFGQWDMALLSDAKILNISYEGDIKQLDLSHFMTDIEGQTLMSKNLWNRVRSHIKVGKGSQ